LSSLYFIYDLVVTKIISYPTDYSFSSKQNLHSVYFMVYSQLTRAKIKSGAKC